MAQFCSLFSGSKANCTYLSVGRNALLIDAGASATMTAQALCEIGADIGSVRGIFVTHEHSDHIKGVPVLASRHNIPVYSSVATLSAMEKMTSGCSLIPLKNGAETEIGGFSVYRFPTSHDCVDPGGYRITLPDGRKFAVCTDLGVMTDTVREAISGCALVLIESNHDLKMLQHGPYPPELKMRIAGQKGHLSNTACASELGGLLHCGTTRFVLGHLSENNNTPMIAADCARAALIDAGASDGDFILQCAAPRHNNILYI